MLADNKQNLKKSIQDEAIADNLDNTAPFKIILESIDGKRGKRRALPHYVNCTTRRRVGPSCFFSFTDVFYPSIPRNEFSEDWDGELGSGFFQSLPFKSLMPWMITPTQEVEKPEPLTDLLRQKYEWNRKWSFFKASYIKGITRKKTCRKFVMKDVLYCPKSYVEMAAHLENDPDPYFTGVNNWYYAGEGNLLVAHLDGSDYIIHSAFNCLYVSPFFKDTLSIDYASTATYVCPEESNILETIQSLNFVALRTKCKVIILRLVTGSLKLERLKEIDSELPFTSIKFDGFHKNMLYVTTLDYKLTIVNLDRMTGRSKKLRGKFSSLVDNWSSVVSGERGNYAHVTKKAITLYDKRTNEPYQRWKNFSFVSDIQSCHDICAVKYCDQKPLMYVATDHHLFLVDMRCGKTKEDNMRPIQRWSHGMLSAPTYIDISAYDHNYNKEMVCLASQWLEDMCIVSNYSDTLTRKGEVPGLTLPYRPPSILQTLNEAHKKKLCYHLYDKIHHRLCTSISGMVIVDRGDCHSILMQNSIGDISCHALYPEHMHAFIEDDSIEKLDEWCREYREEKQFEVSHIIDIEMFLKKLYRVPDDFILGQNTVIKPRIKFNENEIYETFAQEKLDPEFLELWKEQDAEITLDKNQQSQFFVDSQE